MNRRILFLDGSGTQVLPIAKSLCEYGHIIYSLCTEKYSYGYYTKYVKYRQMVHLMPDVIFKEYIIDYIKREQIDFIIPFSDRSAKILSFYKKEFNSLCRFIISDYDSFQNAFEKNRLMNICEKLLVAHPYTIDLTGEGPFDFSSMPFPAIIKPNITTGARGMVIVRDENEFNSVYPSILQLYGRCHLQQFICEGARQFNVHLYIDRNGRLLASSMIWKIRYYPVKAGSSTCCISIERQEDIIKQCYKILSHIGYIGFASFDLIENPKDNTANIMEINPRFPANIGVSLASGIDFANLMVDDIEGKLSPNKNTYHSGKIFRHLGLDFLWFCSSNCRFSTRPSWFNFFGHNVFYQDFDISDPLAFIMGTYGNLRKQLNPTFRNKKAGVQ